MQQSHSHTQSDRTSEIAGTSKALSKAQPMIFRLSHTNSDETAIAPIFFLEDKRA